MQVPVVRIRVVAMGVAQWLVPMRVRVFARLELVVGMVMLMVLVVLMLMVVCHRFVNMGVGMPFCQVKPHPDAHQPRRRQQPPGHWLAAKQSQGGADKRRH
jgi:hypothetical protein